jgi:hypothetical protein
LRTLLALSCLLISTSVSSPAIAFDNERRGFLLGGSIGAGIQAPLLETYGHERLVEGALATGFRIGWGLNSKTEAYLYNGGVTGVTFFYVPIPYTNSVWAGALRRYFHESPSFYASAGAGVGSWSILGITAGAGLGVLAGVGYEYRKHWSVELDGTYTNLGRPGAPFDDPAQEFGPSYTFALRFSGTAY